MKTIDEVFDELYFDALFDDELYEEVYGSDYAPEEEVFATYRGDTPRGGIVEIWAYLWA